TAADIDLLLRGTDVLAQLGQVEEAKVADWSAGRAAEIADLTKCFRRMAEGQPPPATPAPAQPVPPPPESRSPCAPPAALVAPEPGTQEAVELPAKEKPDVPAAEAPATSEAVVRVTAQNLSRLMGLAGESLVQARWLDPFATALLKLKKQQDQLVALLDGLKQALTANGRQDRAETLVAEARRQSALCREVLGERIREFQDHAAQAEDLNSRLYHEVIASRMRPFRDGSSGFPRMVRDMAR